MFLNHKAEQRIEYIDVVKGIAILCVIVGHMGWKYTTTIVYSFHMPLFLICSGYFISEKKSLDVFFREKARRLLLPYAVTCMGLCVMSVVANSVQGMGERLLPDLASWGYASVYGSDISYESPFLIRGIGPIWFLPALFWALLIVKYFGTKKEGAIIILLLAYMACVSSKYLWLPFSIQAGAISAIYVLVGYYLRKYDFLKQKLHVGLLLFATATWIFEVYFGISIDIGSASFSAGGFGILGGIIICYAVLQIAKICSRVTVLKTVLSFCGKNSLLILCIHEIETYFFPGSIAYGVLGIIGLSGMAAEGMILVVKIFFCTGCTLVALIIANKPLQYMGFVGKEK